MKSNLKIIKVDQVNLPNKFHLEIQRHHKPTIFKDKKKYNRKKLLKIDY